MSTAKSLYGLREAPRIWYELLSKELLDIGLKPIDGAPCVFKRADGVFTIIYVDDFLLMAESQEKLNEAKSYLSRKLPTSDLGGAKKLLALKLVHEKDTVTLVQSNYVYALI